MFLVLNSRPNKPQRSIKAISFAYHTVTMLSKLNLPSFILSFTTSNAFTSLIVTIHVDSLCDNSHNETLKSAFRLRQTPLCFVLLHLLDVQLNTINYRLSFIFQNCLKFLTTNFLTDFIFPALVLILVTNEYTHRQH